MNQYSESNNLRFSGESIGGLSTPTSVIIPLIRFAGVTSKAGFQQSIPYEMQNGNITWAFGEIFFYRYIFMKLN